MKRAQRNTSRMLCCLGRCGLSTAAAAQQSTPVPALTQSDLLPPDRQGFCQIRLQQCGANVRATLTRLWLHEVSDQPPATSLPQPKRGKRQANHRATLTTNLPNARSPSTCAPTATASSTAPTPSGCGRSCSACCARGLTGGGRRRSSSRRRGGSFLVSGGGVGEFGVWGLVEGAPFPQPQQVDEAPQHVLDHGRTWPRVHAHPTTPLLPR